MDNLGFILIITAPYWALVLSGFAVDAEGTYSMKQYLLHAVTAMRTFYAFYTPFIWCVLVITMGANPVMIYAISCFAAYVMSAHMMDRRKVPIWQRFVCSLTSVVLISYILYESNLFRPEPAFDKI